MCSLIVLLDLYPYAGGTQGHKSRKCPPLLDVYLYVGGAQGHKTRERAGGRGGSDPPV
jgi:hypothetical protein